MSMGKVAGMFSSEVLAATPSVGNEARPWPAAAIGQSRSDIARAPTHHRGRQESIQLALVDDRPLRRALVVQLLAAGGADFSIATYTTPAELLSAQARGDHIDVVLFNAGTSSLSDTLVQQRLSSLIAATGSTPVAVLCDRQFPPPAREELHQVVEAMSAGLHAYLPTNLEPRVVVEVLRLVCAGGRYLPADTLLGPLRQVVAATSAREVSTNEGADTRIFTPRQLDVLSLLRQGRSNKAIGRALDMQESTVKVHVRQIMRKLNAANRTHAALLAEKLAFASTAPAE